MSEHIKNIVSILIVIIVAHAFMPFLRHEGQVFDPIDDDDYAVIKQRPTETAGNRVAFNQAEQKEIVYNDHHKQQKKSKIKEVSFQLVLNAHTINSVLKGCEIHLSLIQRSYYYQFYKEINPPPPKQA